MWAFKASFTVLLQPKCSWCEFSPPLVGLTLFGHFWQKESLLNLPIPLTLSGRGGGGGGSDARMNNSHLPFRNFLFYGAQMLWLSVFIFKTCSDQILAKLINLEGCCCSFLIKRSQKFTKWKKFPLLGNCWNWHWGGGGNFGSRKTILDINTNFFKAKPIFWGVNSRIWWLVPFFRGEFCDIYLKN